MPGPFWLDYSIFVFIAALGVLQMAAAYSALWGLLFIKLRRVAFALGLLTACAAFLWFFLSEPRNLSDTEGGLDGNQMAGLFSVAAGLALILTILVSSAIGRSMMADGQRTSPGLDALRETTYLHALRTTLRGLTLRGLQLRELWKRY